MNVSLAEVLAGAAVHAVPLTAECAGYLVLGAADQVAGAPRSIGASNVLLSEDGVVRVAGGRAADAEEAERDLRGVLDALLLRASSASAGLLRASRRAQGIGLDALVRELETALIPVNRAAAKRALARLQRETSRALESGRIQMVVDAPSVASAVREASVASAVREASVEPPTVEPPTVAPPRVRFEPSVEFSPVRVELSVNPAPQAAEVAPATSEPLPSVALPPVTAALTPPPPSELEPRDHTVMLAEVALRQVPEPAPEPSLIETRPEPIVLRASARPPAPSALEPIVQSAPHDAGLTERLPPVAAPVLVAPALVPPVVMPAPSASALTPVLGTRVFLHDAEPPAVERAPEPALAADDDEFSIEVIFEADDRAVDSHAAEPLVSEPADRTETCPPLEAESMLPPASEYAAPVEVQAEADGASELGAATEMDGASEAEFAPRAPAVTANVVAEAVVAEAVVAEAVMAEAVEAEAVEAEAVMAEAVEAEAVEAEAEVVLEDVLVPVEEEIELAALVESKLPPWAVAEVPAEELTPPPRVALPPPRPSDVLELLVRMGEAPLELDGLHSGLKRLAGMEPTPPPLGTLASK